MIRRSILWSKIVPLCLLWLNIGCGNRIAPSAEPEALTGVVISLPNECAAVGERPKILFYVDAKGCTSCRLRATMQWFTQNRQVLAGMDSCAVMVVLAPATAEQFAAADVMCRLYDRPDVVLWDSTGTFSRANPVVPQNEIYHTFLLDRNNRVVLVGSPVGNPRMWDLYCKTIDRMIENNGTLSPVVE